MAHQDRRGPSRFSPKPSGESVGVGVVGKVLAGASAEPRIDVPARRSILLVENGQVGQRVAVGLLRRTGHKVAVANDRRCDNGGRERCPKARMDDYVSKPVDPQQLYQVIQEFAPHGPTGSSLDGLVGNSVV